MTYLCHNEVCILYFEGLFLIKISNWVKVQAFSFNSMSKAQFEAQIVVYTFTAL